MPEQKEIIPFLHHISQTSLSLNLININKNIIFMFHILIPTLFIKNIFSSYKLELIIKFIYGIDNFIILYMYIYKNKNKFKHI